MSRKPRLLKINATDPSTRTIKRAPKRIVANKAR